MFDAPNNLPVEPKQGSGNAQPQAPAQPQAAQPQPQKMEGGINVPGTKEPEDIFADINEPAPSTPQTPAPQASPSAPKRGFPWKIILGIGIPLVVIGLGVGAYFVYQNYFAGEDGSLVTDNGQAVAPTTIPATSEPSDEPPVESPIPKPDEDKMAASQASMALLKAQAEQGQMQATGSDMMMVEGMMQAEEGAATDTMDSMEVAEITQPQVTMEDEQEPQVQLSPGVDSDNDGLTNSEELLLGSDPNVTDSDGDGFADGSEVENGYDPAAPDTALAVSNNMKTEKIGTTVFAMPAAWRRNSGPDGAVIVYTGTPANIEISTQNYTGASGLLTWLVNKKQGTSVTDYESGSNMNGAEVVYSSDRLTAWLLMDNTVYTLNYKANGAATLDFLSIFEYMLKSATLAKSN
ncbi:hypothetical protein GF391_00330 [Candidatus Uhrbacteria bacterium]|nr:hypothetical protein [Candidatus Uhrbacteria bacterium]